MSTKTGNANKNDDIINIVNDENVGLKESSLRPRKYLKILLHIIFPIILVFLGAFGYWLYREKVISSPMTKENNKMEKEKSDLEKLPYIEKGREPLEPTISLTSKEVAKFGKYEGEFITARVPQGWRITEYKDGDETAVLPSESQSPSIYQGLTGLTIYNTKGQSIFKLNADNRIGGVEPCDEIFIFDDTNREYSEGLADFALYYASNFKDYNPQVIGLGKNYVDLLILGRYARRIGKTYYWNSEVGLMSFNPICSRPHGRMVEFPILEYKNFDLGDNPNQPRLLRTSNLFLVTFTENIAIEEFPYLDAVLESIRVK